MIQINPLKSYIDGGVRAALTTPPSASLVFDLPGKAIWVKGVKLKGTDHTYTFSHDNYITLTNTPDSNESEDIKIGVNTSALKSAIDTTYGVVSTTANGLAPKFTSGNKQAASAATTYYFLGWAGSTLKWYQAPFRNIRINSETTDCLGVNNTDPLIISSGNGISITWDSTNKKIIITNTKPDVNHNTDTKVAQSVTTQNKNYAIILKGNDSDEGSITTVNFSTYLKFNPSTKQLTINGNKVITTIDTFIGATTSTDGSIGLVTKPLIANRLQFLRGDGTWATPINTWRPVKVEGTEKLGSNALDLSAGNGISIIYNSNTKKIVITNTKPDINHNTDRTGIKLATVSGTKKTDSTLILANSTAGLNIQGGTNKFLIGDGTNYIEVPVTPSFTVSNKDAIIGTALTTIATIAGVDIKAKIASYSLSNHTHSVKINGSTKTIAASGAVDLGNYLPLSGGTMGGTAWIVWPDSGNWGNNNSGVTFPVIRGGLQWSGQSDYVKLFTEETSNDNLNLVLQFGDDNSNGLSIRNAGDTQTAYISATGYITAVQFNGSLNGNASTATALTTNAGDSINPIYFSGGKPVACTMSTGRGAGILRSFGRGTYNSANQYFGNGTIVTIDPLGTGCISANDTILSLGDTSIRNTQLLVTYDRDGVYYRRITDSLNYGAWKKLAFITDIPTVTNYYWANIKVSDSSSTSTSPTFGNFYGKLTAKDNTAANALLHSGAGRPDSSTGDTWIFADDLDLGNWGIKHDQPGNNIDFYGQGKIKFHIPLYNEDAYSTNTFKAPQFIVTNSGTCNNLIKTTNSNYSDMFGINDTSGAGGVYIGQNNYWIRTGNASEHPKVLRNGTAYTLWHAGNDGSGSGLDADLLDGYHASAFATSGHNHDGKYLRKDTNDSTPYQYTFTKTNDHAIKVGTVRGTAVGSQTGEYIHLYERVAIGSPSGWGSRPAPSYGLATYGGAWLATDTGNVGIGTTSPQMKLHVNGVGDDKLPVQLISASRDSTWVYNASFLAPNLTSNHNNAIFIGKAHSIYNAFGLTHMHIGDSSVNNYAALEVWGVGNVQRWYYDKHSSFLHRADFSSLGSDASYMNSALQIREHGYNGTQADTWANAPRMSWHWSGRVQTQIGLCSNNELYLSKNNFGNAYRLVYETGTWGINISGNATSATYPAGFTSRGTSDWSGVPGTLATDWSVNGADIMFKYDGSKLNVITDGRFYQGIDAYGASKRVLDEYDINHTTWGYASNSDTVDGYHASAFVKIKQFRFSQYNQGTWTKILTITINSTADLQPVIAFSWIPSECNRDIWADFSISWRSNSPIFYAIWKGMNSRTLKVVNYSGAIWDVWISGNKAGWDPFGEIQVTYTHNITSYNGGSLGYSDTDPGGTICITGGQVNYANSAASATKLQTPRTIWGQSFDGTGNISGSLSGVGHIQFSANNTYNIGSNSAASKYIYTYWLGAKSGQKLELGANNSNFGQGLCIDTNLNVGIGINTPTYKLHVIGDIYTTTGFKKSGSSDSYVLLGGGGHQTISSLSVNYANSAGNADTTDGLHLYTRSLGVNGTSWTFASTANANSTTNIYAATSAGTSGQILKSTGGTPTWINQSDISAGYATYLNVQYCRDDDQPSNKGLWNTIKNGTTNAITNRVRFYTIYGTTTALGAPVNGFGELLEICSYNINHWQPQLWFGSGKDGRLYYRNKNYNNNSWGAWRTVAWTSDIPTVTDYYWANVKISASSSTSTSPTFSTCYANNWFRSYGQTGWYNETYSGGWYMNDTTWIRTWNKKGIYIDTGTIYNLGHAYFACNSGYNVGIGTTTPSYKLDVRGSERIYSTYPQLRVENSSGGTAETSIYVSNGTAGWAIGVNVWGIGGGVFGIGQYSGTGSSNWRFKIDNNGYCYTQSYLNLGSGNEKNAKNPPYVWGVNGSDNYLRTYATSSLRVAYASSAGNADTLDGNHASAFATAGHNHFTRLSGTNIDTELANMTNQHYEISNATGTLPFTETWRQVYVMGGGDSNYTTQISTGLTTNTALYFRHRRSGSWDDWRTVLDSANYSSYALPLSGGTMTAGARISHANGNLYLGRADNNGWVMCQDMCSHTASGDTYWSLRTNGTFHALTTCIGGHLWLNKQNTGSSTGGASQLIFGNNGTQHVVISSNTGAIVINPSTSSSTGQIVLRVGTSTTSDFAGNINAAHFYENSDIRYKRVLRNLSINSNTIANLPLFDFEWIENNVIGTGTSAQAVQQILPNIISGTDKLTLDYGVLGTIAGITACKELVTQKSELQQLKEKVKQLEDKLRKYENI